MKSVLLFVALAMCVAPKCHSQGWVYFANNNSRRVYYVTETGSTTFIPIGSQFTAELMFAPDGTPADDFDSLAIRVGATTTFGPTPGLFNGGGRTVQSITPAGGYGLFQVRVWETAAGSSYAAAVATGDPRWRAGISGILRVDTVDPTIPGGGIYSAVPYYGYLVNYGLTSFIATPVPEPSTIALALLGTGFSLLLRRARRNSNRVQGPI